MGQIQTEYTANTGAITISTANSNLDGTGAVALLTAGANGTLVRTVIIKAQTTTGQGMIRFYVNNGSGSAKLIHEVCVPVVTKSGRDYSFYRIIPFNYSLQSGDILYATTEVGNTFNIIAEGLDWSYASDYAVTNPEFTANSGIAKISTANTNLNGTGTCPTVLTSGGNGTLLIALIIKAQQTVTPGMVRLYLKNLSSAIFLFAEVAIPALTYSATAQSFMFKASFTLAIQAGFLVLASTENGEAFSVIIDGHDWAYTSIAPSAVSISSPLPLPVSVV